MKSKQIIFLGLLLLSWWYSFAYKELIIENIDKKPVRVIKVVLDGEHYIVSSPAGEWGETLKELTTKVGGDTAVNGVFFCPDDYTQCNGVTHTISERIYMWNGKDWSAYRPDTSIRMVFGFNKQWEPLLAQNNLGKLYDVGIWMKPDKEKFDSLYFGLWNFPVFLYEGEDVMNGYTNYIDKKMKTAGNKTFICSTQDKTTIYMWVIGGITLLDMATYLKKNFNCRNAMNLDAGNSIGMIYSGFVLDQGPRTKIMDAFVVVTKQQYENLTTTTPSYKTTYIPPTTYILTTQDQQTIKNLYNTLQTFIKKLWSKQKRSFVSLLRAAINSPKISADPQKLALIKELLFKLYIIESL